MSDNLGPAPGGTNSTSAPDSSAHDPATQTELDAAKGLPVALTGAVLATRYVGRWAATGAPATGTFAVGDFGFDGANTTQICSVAGSPGTWVAAGGGSGTSSLLSESEFAHIGFSASPGQALVAGADFVDVDFRGATISQGPVWYGAGTALPLAITIDADVGYLEVPDVDAVYVLDSQITLTCDAADVGKLVGFRVSGIEGSQTMWSPVRADLSAKLNASAVALMFAGDGNDVLYNVVCTEFLTQTCHVTGAYVNVVKR